MRRGNAAPYECFANGDDRAGSNPATGGTLVGRCIAAPLKQNHSSRKGIHTMKKAIAVLLACVLLCGFMAFTASAAIDDWGYTIHDGNATITGYAGTETELAVPSEIDGYAVTAIADNALGNRTDLTIVHLPLTISVATARIFGSHNPALRVCSETNDSYTSSMIPYFVDGGRERKITSANGIAANGLTICLCDGINHGVDLLISDAPFWSDWSPFMQFVLKYIFFGWLWMGWF